MVAGSREWLNMYINALLIIAVHRLQVEDTDDSDVENGGERE